MSRVRIVCKAPPDPPAGQWLLHRIPGDARVVIVDDDGTEREVPGVLAARWSCKAGETTRAVLVLEGVEAEAELGEPA